MMIAEVFFISISMLAAVGLVHICYAIKLWVSNIDSLSGCRLVVPIQPADTTVEAKLLQAHSALATVASLRHVDMVVVCSCPLDSENMEISSRFCTDKGVSMVKDSQVKKE